MLAVPTELPRRPGHRLIEGANKGKPWWPAEFWLLPLLSAYCIPGGPWETSSLSVLTEPNEVSVATILCQRGLHA